MYIQDCLNLRDAGPATFGQYFHGGVLPTLDKDRKAGLLDRGEWILQKQNELLIVNLDIVTDMDFIDGLIYTGEVDQERKPYGRGSF